MHPKGSENVGNTGSFSSRVRRGLRSPGLRIFNQPSCSYSRRAPASSGAHNLSCPENFYSSGTGSFMNAFYPTESYGCRTSYTPPHSTPIQPLNFPDRQDVFGAQLDYNLSWTPKEADPTHYIDPTLLLTAHPKHKNQSSRYFAREYTTPSRSTGSMENKDQLPSDFSSKHLLKQSYLRDAEAAASISQKRSPKRESLMEWFDRTVELELKSRREASLNMGENVINLEAPSFHPVNRSRKTNFTSNPHLTESSMSGMEIQSEMRGQKNTELLDAVDKLAEAEAICVFEGAVNAAEEAAASVPPEFAEEAAAAGAQGFQAELTNVVRQEFDGVKPIEVVGYVGVTRPNKPKKSK